MHHSLGPIVGQFTSAGEWALQADASRSNGVRARCVGEEFVASVGCFHAHGTSRKSPALTPNARWDRGERYLSIDYQVGVALRTQRKSTGAREAAPVDLSGRPLLAISTSCIVVQAVRPVWMLVDTQQWCPAAQY